MQTAPAKSVRVEAAALRVAAEKPLLRGLAVVAAGFHPHTAGQFGPDVAPRSAVTILYCVKGGGWVRLGGGLVRIAAGDVLVLSPDAEFDLGQHASNPWAVHWVQAVGANVSEYLAELALPPRAPVFEVGSPLRLKLLFDEILNLLEHGTGYGNLMAASHALGHLLGLLVLHRKSGSHPSADVTERVARSIIYMSEHLDEPLRVSALAAMASVSPSHFTALFKQQTGCSPRSYLHLLRIHRARELLRSPALSIKDVSQRVGYQDPFHFSRQFKAFVGVSPTQFRLGS